MRIGFTGCLLVLWAGCLGAQPASVRPAEETSSVTAVERPDPEGVDFMADGIPFNADGFVARGTRVRVRSSEVPGQSYVGRVIEIDGESQLLGFPGGVGPLRLRSALITRMEVSVGRHNRGKKGAAVAAQVLGVLGAAAGAVLSGYCESGCDAADASRSVLGALCGGFFGATTGAAVGSLIGDVATTDTWQRVSPRQSVGARRGRGLTVSASLRF